MNIKKCTILVFICFGFLTVSSPEVLVSSIFDNSSSYTALTLNGPIDVSTDKSIYQQGENVTIIITNIGETRIEIAGPCYNVSNEQGESVFSGCLFCYFVLEPGESETLIWNQKDMEGKQVPKGKYTVEGSFPVIGDKTYVDNTSFYIKKGKNPIGNEQLISITHWLISTFRSGILSKIFNL
jgi:hypothetical protein